MKSWWETRVDVGAQSSAQLELEAHSDTSKGIGRVRQGLEFPGGLEACKGSLISPADPSSLSLQMLTIKGGERGYIGSFGSHSSQNHQGGFPGPKAVWQVPLVELDTTAVQRKANNPRSPGVPLPQPDLVP